MRMHLESNSVHAGREDLEILGVHALPIDLSTTYPLRDLPTATASFDDLSDGEAGAPNPIYARLHNPTVHRFERALAVLERAEESVAFASGMAALTACLLAARERGRHVIALRPLYGGSDHLLSSGLLDIDVTFCAVKDIASAIRDDTSLVMLETPANPTVAITDIEDVVTRASGVPVLVDSTFATPVLQNPIVHGASLVLHSATKAIGGHGDAVGGVVATGSDFARELRKVRAVTGGILHPLAAYQLHRGLQTLAIRVERAQANAMAIATRLAAHPAVERLHFPGYDAPKGVIARQMRGPGSVLAFSLWKGFAHAVSVLKELSLITPAVSLGCNDTLIQHPAGLTHRCLTEEARRAHGIDPGLLRLSVGIENVEDLWADLDRALLAAFAEAATRPAELVSTG